MMDKTFDYDGEMFRMYTSDFGIRPDGRTGIKILLITDGTVMVYKKNDAELNGKLRTANKDLFEGVE